MGAFGKDNVDTGSLPISAREMRTKMKSRNAVMMAANDTSAVNDPDTNFEQVDSIGAARCAEINTESINTAINMLPEATRERYNSIGQPLVASDADLAVCNAGPCWIWSRLEYDNDGESVTLSSPSLAENQNPL